MATSLSTTTDEVYFIPQADMGKFTALNEEVREDILDRFKVFRHMDRAKSKRRGALDMADPERDGWSADRHQKLYKLYHEQGWTGLLNRRKAGPSYYRNRLIPTGLPEAFLDWLAEKLALNQRDKFKTVRAQVIRQWRRWRKAGGGPKSKEAIPGYAVCPDPVYGKTIPAGWSLSNLTEKVKKHSDKRARKLVQIGSKAAAEIGPKILSTRVGTEVGQFILWDDSWNDFEVQWRNGPCRQLAFHALDLTSGCNVMRGFKPAGKDEKGAMEGLKYREMIWLSMCYFTTYGYHPTGTTCICEKATATINDREAQIYYDCTGGKIKVDTGPAGGGPGLGALFTGPSGGNPRWKAPLESWFNLLRNETADLLEFPGQTGSNSRLNKPEGLDALKAETRALATAAAALTKDDAQLLSYGMLSHEEAMLRCNAIIDAINKRDDHKLEGWRKCGFYETRLQIAENLPWVPATNLLGMPENKARAIVAASTSDEFALSPHEVCQAGRKKLRRISPETGALLLANLPGEERPVVSGQLTLNMPEVDRDEELVYGCTIRDGHGREEKMRVGDKYLVRVNPLMPEVAFLYGAQNQYQGVVQRWNRSQRDDTDDLERQHKEKSKSYSPVLKEARRAGAPITRKETRRKELNTKLLKGIQKGDVKALTTEMVEVDDNTAEYLED